EGALAPDAVAEMAEHDAADRTGDEADGEGGEGCDLRRQRRQVRGEEQGGKDQRGRRGVDEEVVPLDRRRRRGDGRDLDDPATGSLGAHSPPPWPSAR